MSERDNYRRMWGSHPPLRQVPQYAHTEETCPGHVASADDSKVCGRCGVHVDSLRPLEDDSP